MIKRKEIAECYNNQIINKNNRLTISLSWSKQNVK